MKKEINATVIYNREAAKATYEVCFMTEPGLDVKPGQFANLMIGSSANILRRPISINHYDDVSGEMLLLYKVVGSGTARLSNAKKDDVISMVVPLGNGFNILDRYKRIFLVGGGVGCPPLEAVMLQYPDREYVSFLGFDTQSSIYHEASFKKRSQDVFITTIDGSHGEKGLVTAPLKRALDENPPDVLLACGPMPMLKAIQDVMKDTDCDAYISAEQRMGCGVGGCSVCVIETKTGFKKVCHVGPVFRLDEVVF